ncbi:MAG: hypothetical protein K2X38_08305 [Gemmataceae bacterium]|nr:hypothetical protein [Gemmataceae bacterium]
MRFLFAACLIFGLTGSLLSQDEPKEAPSKLKLRYGMDFQNLFYLQGTPEEAMKSIAKAVDNQRLDYLLAHLSDPSFVDRRVEEYKRDLAPSLKETTKQTVAFDRFVSDAKRQFDDDPTLVRELRLFAKQGEWDTKEDTATGTLKGINRKVYLKKLENRWFLENRQR